MGKSQKTPWTLIICILTVLSLLAVIAYGRLLSQEYKELSASLKNYTEEASSKNAAIARLHASIGYGGLIHNFKNYILRQDEEYYNRVIVSFDQTNYWMNRLGQVIKTEDQIDQLRLISKTVQDYRSKFYLAVRYVEQGITPRALDEIVKINDAQALSALVRLSEISQKRSEEFLHKTTEANQRYTLNLNLMFILGIFIVLVGGTIIFIVKRLSKVVEQTDEAYNYILALYDATPDALFAVNKDGIIQKANRQAESIFGYSIDVLIGMPVEQLMPEAIRQAHEKMREGYFANPGSRAMGSGLDLHARRSDGREIDVEISLSHSRINDQEQALVAIRDMTHARKIEKDLAISLKRENRAAQFKSKLLSNMSHELRTPLNQISGFSQLMLRDAKGDVSDKVKIWAHKIDQSSQDLIKLINNILSFSEKDITRGKVKVLNIRDYFSDFKNQLTHNAFLDKAEIRINSKADQNNTVYCARTVLDEALIEVIDNAIKFSDQDKPSIDISMNIENKIMEVMISDDGVGIADHHREDVFKPFERLNAFDHAIDGIGMGLTVVRQMVEASDGTISFVDQDKKGACVEIRLPVSNDPF